MLAPTIILSKSQKFDINKEVMECLINRLRINYKVMGEGRPFLILHGWGSCAEKWQKVGELLAEKRIKVIIPDLPGFGKSLTPQSAWGLDEYSDFVKEFVDFLNLDKFYFLGHSFGGSLAAKFSSQHPEKVAKLILVAAACVRKKDLKVKFLKTLSKIFKVKPTFLRKLFYRKSDYLSVQGIMKEVYLKVIKEDLLVILPQIQVPTIIIWGKEDKITPLKHAYIINSKIKSSQLEIIPGFNHNPHLEAPEKLSGAVIKYL